MHNPYQSPASSSAEVPQHAGKRPVSVWLLLLILVPFSIAAAVGAVRFAWITITLTGMHAAFLTAIAWRLAVLAFLVYTVVGIARRRQWGRWLGVLIVGAITVGPFILPDTTHYADNAERTGGYFGRYILLPGLMAWWLYACGFSSKARRYFSD